MSADVTMVSTVPDVKLSIEQWNAYQELCKGLLNGSDYQEIIVKEKDESGNYFKVKRSFKKKSAWQKLSRAFNVDTSILTRELQRTKTGRINEAYYCVRATLPNGRSVESDALCSRSEKGKGNLSDHSIMSIAKTRATNRAISEIIGAGEVSSDEMTAECVVEESSSNLIENTPKTSPAIETPKNTVVDDFVSASEIESETDTSPSYIEPKNSNASESSDDIKEICQNIKGTLEKLGKPINKISLRKQAIKLIKLGEIDESLTKELMDFIQKNCPEELE